MLTESERNEIETHLVQYPYRQGGVIDALKVVQRHRTWVSDEAIADLAAFLDMDPSELDSVATYYNLIFRKPVGRHVILMCNSVSCWVMGCNRLQQSLTQTLDIEMGETTNDNRFTLLPVPCLGACEQAPAVLIDDDLHGDVSSEGIEDILRRYE
ncbi:MAG: NADH-quinone oxidoreductase subunit NuoE [Gammaproteobacteria bacterium]|jgi:NADH-quinone oxidoreductase subunit E